MRGFAVFIFLITFASHLLVIFVWLDEKVSCYQSPFIVDFHSAHTPTMGALSSFAAQRNSANKDLPFGHCYESALSPARGSAGPSNFDHVYGN